MPDRKNPESRWSSAREREERDRRRMAQREEAKQARLDRDVGKQSSSFSGSTPRRLTDEERRTISEYRFPSAAAGGSPPAGTSSAPVSPSPGPASAQAESTTLRPSSGTSTKWRESVGVPVSGGGPGLPDLPGDGNGTGGKRPGNARLLIFGIALFASMALVAFLPFGPLGGDDEPAIPTSSAILPTLAPVSSGGVASDAPETDDAVAQPAASAGQVIVCIDPGHGGWDTGWNRTDQDEGEGPYSSPIVTEAEINLGMAYMLKEQLEAEGMFVVLTRPSGAAVNMYDQDVNGDGETRLDAENTEQAGDRDELQARIYACNEANADVLISLHINGYDDPAANGYEVLYTAERDFGSQNEELANLVYRRMDSALRDTDMGGKGRGAIPDTELDNQRHEFGTAQHLIITGPAFEEGSIDPSLMPGLIVEAAFLSNDQDAAWIVQPDNQRLVIQAYRDGIMDYFERYPPGS